VADQLELEDRLLGGHRLHPELLRLHDHWALLVGHNGARLQRGAVALVAPVPAAFVAVASGLAFELLDELVNGGAHIGGALPGAQDGPFRPHCRLGDLVFGDGRIALHGELELEPSRRIQMLVELAKLFLGIALQGVADFDVLALDLQSHEKASSSLTRKSTASTRRLTAGRPARR
jgi:hypothetical protein